MARASFRPGDPSQQAAPKAPGGGLGLGGAVKAARASFRPGDPSQAAAPQQKKSIVPGGGVDGQRGPSQPGEKDKIQMTKELAPELQRAIAAELQVGLETIQNTVQVEILEVIEELQTQVQNLSKRFEKWKEEKPDETGGAVKDDKKGGEANALKIEMHNFRDLMKSMQDDVSKMQKSIEVHQQQSTCLELVVRKLEYIGDREKDARRGGAGSPIPGSPQGKAVQGRIITSLQTDLKREMERARKMEDRIMHLEDKAEVGGSKFKSAASASPRPEGGDAKKGDKPVSGFAQVGARAAKKDEEEKLDLSQKNENEIQKLKNAITGLRKDLKTETEERIAKDEEITKSISELKGGGDKAADKTEGSKTIKKLNIQG